MDLIAILSTVILLVTIGTIAVAVAAYAAFKLRDKRKPKKGKLEVHGEAPPFEPVFLKRYMPPNRSDVEGEQSSSHH
jgi:heme/copper-type cytochrome/quinol oxidase subunit 2